MSVIINHPLGSSHRYFNDIVAVTQCQHDGCWYHRAEYTQGHTCNNHLRNNHTVKGGINSKTPCSGLFRYRFIESLYLRSMSGRQWGQWIIKLFLVKTFNNNLTKTYIISEHLCKKKFFRPLHDWLAILTSQNVNNRELINIIANYI